jgi:DNA-binding winged helix-turn-helix (wHTH) protein
MRQSQHFVFGPYRLDVSDERLWREGAVIPLGRKAFAVLHSLVRRARRLVTKEELFADAWQDTAVSEAVLTTAVREVRRALGDRARAARFVETVHGRGYRFIASVSEAAEPELPARDAGASEVNPPGDRAGTLVGRQQELARLRQWHSSAQQRKRWIGLIAGEAGIGKTSLVEAFVAEISTSRVIRGQCVEHYGAGEAYLPILEALGRLGRDRDVPLGPILREHAPSWLAHLPSLSAREGVAAGSVRPERMLRELAEALEVFTAEPSLVLVLEDLHWSDTATLEWLAYVARRRDPARLLVLCTYRPIATLSDKHPLRNVVAELRRQSQCAELTLGSLGSGSVEEYVRQRCGTLPHVEDVAKHLYRRTGGHPLFFTAIVEDLLREEKSSASERLGALDIAGTIPTSVRQFIEHRFEQLSTDDQAIIEAASVVGDVFPIAAVASSSSEEVVEARCASFARDGGFLVADGTTHWPDGTMTPRYRFRHALFQEAAYARISPELRVRHHRHVGNRLERAYGEQSSAIAAELAVHFEQGRDLRKATRYLEQAARNTLQRSAYPEAHRHLVHARELLTKLPESRERLRRELALSLLLGQVLETTKGWAVDEVEHSYSRARELSRALGDESHRLQATWGLVVVGIVRAELRRTQVLSREILRLARKKGHRMFTMASHMELGGTALVLGEAAAARKHFHEADALYDPRHHQAYVASFGADLGQFSRIWSTHLMWLDGHSDRARATAEETVALARELAHPFTLTIVLAYAGMLHQFRRDHDEVDNLADAAIAHASDHGFPYYLAWAKLLRGWSRGVRTKSDKGSADIREALEVLEANAKLRLPYYRALLADACAREEHFDEAFQALDRAFEDARQSEENWWLPELHRLRGELLDRTTRAKDKAEASLHTALAIARRQRAKSLELRAAVSLGRMLRDRGKHSDAGRLIDAVYGTFTEGFETADLRDARMLLEELSSVC